VRARTIEFMAVGLFALLAILDGGRIVLTSEGGRGPIASGGYLTAIGLVLLALALAYHIPAIRRPPESPTAWGERAGLKRVGLALAMAVGYVTLITPLGYLLATALFFIVYLKLFSSYSWLLILAGSALGAMGSAYLWASLGLMLPSGIIPWP
jgi:hypothetical protein